MLPWLAFSEAIGRAPAVILENRVLVKKVVFPVEILPVTHVISGLVTQAFAAGDLYPGVTGVPRNVPATIAVAARAPYPSVVLHPGIGLVSVCDGCVSARSRPDDWFSPDALVLPDADLL